MFKLVAELSDIDTEQLIDNTFRMLKELPDVHLGGLKLPPFLNAQTMKLMPKETLLRTFATSFQADSARMLPMLEQAIYGILGPVKLSDAACQAYPKDGVLLSLQALAEVSDPEKLLSLASSYLDEEGYQAIFPEEGGAFDRAQALERLHALPDARKEYAALKLFSTHKPEVIRKLEDSARQKNVPVKLYNIRFLLPKG